MSYRGRRTVTDWVKTLVSETHLDAVDGPVLDFIDRLERFRPRDLSDAALDVLERGCAALIGAVRDEQLRRAGLLSSSSRWGPRAPGARSEATPYGRYWEIRVPFHLQDHARTDRWVHRDGKRSTIHVSEPYYLGSDDLLALAGLIGEGWDVTIRPSMARHYPGETMALWWRRRPAAMSVEESV